MVIWVQLSMMIRMAHWFQWVHNLQAILKYHQACFILNSNVRFWHEMIRLRSISKLQIDKPIKVFTTKEAGEYFKSIITGKSALAEPKDLFVNITPDDMPPWPPTKFLLPFAMAVGSCLLIMLVSYSYSNVVYLFYNKGFHCGEIGPRLAQKSKRKIIASQIKSTSSY